jgi:translation initiation factor IF-2
MPQGGPTALRTQHAIEASQLASAMNAALQKLRIAPGEYAAELTEPEGPSTGGGVQARQNLRLVPRAPGFPTLVAGHANHADGTAELRSFEYLNRLHKKQFDRPVELDATQYGELLVLARGLFEALRLRTALVDAPPDLVEATLTKPPPPPRSSGRVVGIVVVVGVVAGVAVWLLSRG